MLAVGLSLTAAIFWGLADFLGGLETRRTPGSVVVILSQATGLLAACACAVAFGELWSGEEAVAWALAAGSLIAIGILAFYRALAIGTMSIVAPLSAAGVVVPVVVGLLNGESLDPSQIVGMAIGAAGILLASLHAEPKGERRNRARASIALALVSAALIGIALAAFDRSAEDGVLPTLLWAKVAAVVTLSVVVLVTRPELHVERNHFLPIAGIGLLDVAATGLFTLATTEGFLSIVAIVSSLYPVVTVLLARAVLHERVRPVQMAGVVCALLGVGLIAAGQ